MHYRQNVHVSFGGFSAGAPQPRPDWIAFDPATSSYLAVPVRLNGLPVRGVVDTGASRSVVSPKLLGQIGAQPAGSTLATMFTARYSLPLYRTGRLEVGGIATTGLDVACHDLAMVEAAFPGEGAMVIGRDFLTRAVLECQFSRNRLRITVDCAPAKAAGYTRLELGRSFHGLPVIAAKIEGLEPERAVVDLGSNLVCTMSERYAQDAGLLCRPSSTTMSAGLEGNAVGTQITLRTLRIGEHVLRDVPACVIPNWSLDAPLNLGWPAFGAFDLAFVFDRELRIRADEALLAAPLPRDRSGIGAQRLRDHLLVRHVSPLSPADRQGLVEGDRIIAIDGVPVDSYYPAPGRRLGGQSVGTKMALTLERGREVSLVLEDYF
jgi:predicted aspartyl protease